MADPSTFKQEDQGGNVAVYGPDGTLYKNVPESHLQELVKGGGMPAVRVQGTDGNIHYVPASHTAEVIQGGGKLLPFEQQSVKHPGVWQTVWDYVKSIPESITGPDPLADPRVSDEEKNRLVAEQQEQAAATNEARTKAHGLGYSLAATAGEGMIGVPVSQMEQSAEEGNVRGVIGGALAVPATAAATYVVGKGVGAAVNSDFATSLAKNLQEVPEKVRNVTPKQAAQTVGGVTGGVAGHGTLSAPGAYYGAKSAGRVAEAVLGKERANAPIIKPKPPVNPGAPLPANPGTEVLQGNALSTVDQPVKPPNAAALGRIPAAQPSGSAPTVFRGSTQQVAPFKLSDLPPQAVSQAVQELGENAPIAEVKQRAQDIANKFQHKPLPSTRKGAAVPETQEQMLARMRSVEQAHGSPAQPQEMAIPDKMPLEHVGALEETAFGRKPEEIDIGNKLREENPEPSRGEVANAKAQEQAKALGELQKPPAEVLNQPLRNEYPPEAPQSKVQPSKPSQADLDETEAIRSRIERQAQAEDNARMRQMRGEYKERNDVSTPKGTLTGAAGEGNDVSLADRSSAAQPDVTKLAKEIATPQQAMRQLELLKKAGASQNAMTDFTNRAEVKFGKNWQHVAEQSDNLEGMLNKSLNQVRKQQRKNPPPVSGGSKNVTATPNADKAGLTFEHKTNPSKEFEGETDFRTSVMRNGEEVGHLLSNTFGKGSKEVMVGTSELKEPGLRGKGIGKEMYQQHFDFLRSNNVTKLHQGDPVTPSAERVWNSFDKTGIVGREGRFNNKFIDLTRK